MPIRRPLIDVEDMIDEYSVVELIQAAARCAAEKSLFCNAIGQEGLSRDWDTARDVLEACRLLLAEPGDSELIRKFLLTALQHQDPDGDYIDQRHQAQWAGRKMSLAEAIKNVKALPSP